MKIIKNGLVYTAVKDTPEYLDILIDGSKIIKLGNELTVAEDVEVIDARGMSVYPGFIDCHTHLGVSGSSIGFEGSDSNEPTDPVTPQLRVIDAINPHDKTFFEALSAGVTCVGTGPGSANVVGGQYTAIKTAGHRVDDMIVKETVAMKCALGENPKRCYQNKDNSSRMATAAKLREILIKTKEYDDKKKAAMDDASKMPGFDFKLESMLPVIHKEIPLKIHAHQANDIFTAIRIAKEFDVKMTLEHVTDGGLIVEELKKAGYPLAVGPSLHAKSKYECKNLGFDCPVALSNAGIEISIITDAPVVPLQHLSMCAGIAVANGMDEAAALRAITINPAKHLGIEDRVGSIEIGKDADFVLIDGDPFDIVDDVKMVLVDGEVVYSK